MFNTLTFQGNQTKKNKIIKQQRKTLAHNFQIFTFNTENFSLTACFNKIMSKVKMFMN